MTQSSPIFVLSIGVLGLIGLYGLLFGVSAAEAQERGLGVSPAKIEIDESVEWPYTVPITITNFSAETDQFELMVEKPSSIKNFSVGIDSGRFLLESGARRRVLLTFEKPGQETKGLIAIVSTRISPEEFVTSTGVKVPYHISSKALGIDDTRFLAGVSKVGGERWSTWLFGAGMILATLILLWFLSDSIRTWIFNSNKHSKYF